MLKTLATTSFERPCYYHHSENTIVPFSVAVPLIVHKAISGRCTSLPSVLRRAALGKLHGAHGRDRGDSDSAKKEIEFKSQTYGDPFVSSCTGRIAHVEVVEDSDDMKRKQRELLQSLAHVSSVSYLLEAAVPSPLTSIVSNIQRRAAMCLLHQFGLMEQLHYLRELLLLGDAEVMEPMQETVLLWIENRYTHVRWMNLKSVEMHSESSSHQSDRSLKIGVPTFVPVQADIRQTHKALVSRLNSHYLQRAPTRGGILAVTAAFASGEPELDESHRSECDRLRGILGEGHPLSMAGTLRIQLHYARPLDIVLTAEAVGLYNEILTLLMRLSVVGWVAEALWRKCSIRGGRCDENTRRHLAGIHSLCFFASSIRRYLLSEIHSVTYRNFLRAVKRGASPNHIKQLHDNVLVDIKALLSPTLSLILLEILQCGMVASTLVLDSIAFAQRDEIPTVESNATQTLLRRSVEFQSFTELSNLQSSINSFVRCCCDEGETGRVLLSVLGR